MYASVPLPHVCQALSMEKEKANIETESIGYHALVDMGGPLQGRQNIQCNGHLNIKQKK